MKLPSILTAMFFLIVSCSVDAITQAEFERRQSQYYQRYDRGINEIQKSEIFNLANDWSSVNAPSQVKSWRGVLNSIDTPKGGGYATIRVKSNKHGIVVWYIGNISHDLYASLMGMPEKEHIVFNGSFKRASNGLVEERSITEQGRMREPEFSFRFSSIARDEDYYQAIREQKEERRREKLAKQEEKRERKKEKQEEKRRKKLAKQEEKRERKKEKLYGIDTLNFSQGELKKYESEIRTARMAVKEKSNSANRRNKLGDTFKKYRRYDEAIVQYQKASELKQKYATPAKNLGIVSVQIGKYEEGIGFLLRSLEIKGERKLDSEQKEEAHLFLGIAYLQLEDNENAISNLRKCKGKLTDEAISYLQQIHNWENEIWSLIIEKQVSKGMNKEQVRLSWGEPNEVEKEGTNESWLYEGKYLFFEANNLTEVESF